MADTTGKTPGKRLLDTLGLGSFFGGGTKKVPDPKLVGEPAEPAMQRLRMERLDALNPEQRDKYFEISRPHYQVEEDSKTDFADAAKFPTCEVAYSTDHGKKGNNEDGVFVDPLSDFGVVVDGVSTGGYGRVAAAAALNRFARLVREPQMVEAELRTRKVKNTPENRLKLMGHKVHEAIRGALEEREGGAVVAGTYIEGNKLYSFVLGEATNIVIRGERIVFCSRPTSRLQRFAETFNVPNKDLRKKVEAYLNNTPVEKIRAELHYPPTVTLETIKRTIWSDPIQVLGFDDADVSVEEFDLEPGDTIISVTDGITDPLGLRVIPTKKDPKSGRWSFDREYNGLNVFPMFEDPLLRLAKLVGRDAEETRDNILKLFQPKGPGAAGTDPKTVLVRQQPLPAPWWEVTPEDDPEKTPWSGFTPTPPPGTSRSSSLPPIGPDYGDEKTPIDESRRHLPRPPAVEPPPTAAPSRPGAGGPPPLPRFEVSRPTAPSWPEADWPEPEEPEVTDKSISSALPAREETPPAPLPSYEDERKREEIERLKTRIAELATLEFDTRRVAKDERAADVILYEVWDVQDRLAALEGKSAPVRNQAERVRVEKNKLRYEIELYDKERPSSEATYARRLNDKQWGWAWSVLYRELYLGRIIQIEQSYALACLEGRFDLLKSRTLLLKEERGTSRVQVAEVYPPNDPETPHMVVMNVLEPGGKITRRMAFTAQEWQRKFEKGQLIAGVDTNDFPFEAKELIGKMKEAVDQVRLWYRAGNYSLKFSEGRFAGTAYEPLYADLHRLLQKYPEDYTPKPPFYDGEVYADWADDIQQLQEEIHKLSKPTP